MTTNFALNSKAVRSGEVNCVKFNIIGVDFYYGSFHALKNINMQTYEPQVTAFIGPSGCGKSTLAQVPQPHERPDSGLPDDRPDAAGRRGYLLAGLDVNQLRKRVGMVFQKPNPFPMSIYDNIAYGPRTHGIQGKVMLDEIVENACGRPRCGTR